MQRSAATVVCVVSETGARWVDQVDAANVGVCSPPAEQPVLERATVATRMATSAHIPYFVHDADPLELVARSWVSLFDTNGPIGEVEVATAETLARWRNETLELPDYYLVTDADTMSPTRRHWFFGVLHEAAPARVIPARTLPSELVTVLEELKPGRWWPPLPQLLDGIERRAPDAVATTEGDPRTSAFLIRPR